METRRKKPLSARYSTLTTLSYNFIINHKKETDWHQFLKSKTYDICKTEYILCLLFVLTGMNFSVTLLPILLILRTTIVTSCTASYSVQGQVLQNHTFKTETTERIENCTMLCTAYPGCHSSNFYPIDKRCELNDKTHASHPEDMIHEPYTIYMENIFRPMRCTNMLDCGRQMICSSSLLCEGMPCTEVK